MGRFFASRMSWEYFESQLKFYPKGVEDFPHSFGNLKIGFLNQMKQFGNEQEQNGLQQILEDLEYFIPKNISIKEQWRAQNLLKSIIFLWCIGKASSDIENTSKLHRVMKQTKPNKDPRLHLQLFPLAYEIYRDSKKNAQEIEDFLIRREVGLTYATKYCTKNRSKAILLISKKLNIPVGHFTNATDGYLANEIFGQIMQNEFYVPQKGRRLPQTGNLCWKDKKLSLKDNTSLSEEELHSYRYMLQQTKQPTYKDALEKANRQSFLSQQIIPKEEFDAGAFEQGFKDWIHKRNKRRQIDKK